MKANHSNIIKVAEIQTTTTTRNYATIEHFLGWWIILLVGLAVCKQSHQNLCHPTRYDCTFRSFKAVSLLIHNQNIESIRIVAHMYKQLDMTVFWLTASLRSQDWILVSFGWVWFRIGLWRPVTVVVVIPTERIRSLESLVLPIPRIWYDSFSSRWVGCVLHFVHYFCRSFGGFLLCAWRGEAHRNAYTGSLVWSI